MVEADDDEVDDVSVLGCVDCPDGGHCAGDDFLPTPAEGQWIDRSRYAF